MAEVITFGSGPISDSEASFRDYLQAHLGQDSKVLTQYPMRNINQGKNGDTRWTQRPDFIVISPNVGIWVLEVKHWRPDTIAEFHRAKVFLDPKDANGDPHREIAQNPYAQVDEYLKCVKAEFKNSKRTLNQRFGNPSVPYGSGVIFTNISRQTFCVRGHDTYAQLNKTLFRDELSYANGSGFSWHLLRWLEKPRQRYANIHHLVSSTP